MLVPGRAMSYLSLASSCKQGGTLSWKTVALGRRGSKWQNMAWEYGGSACVEYNACKCLRNFICCTCCSWRTGRPAWRWLPRDRTAHEPSAYCCRLRQSFTLAARGESASQARAQPDSPDQGAESLAYWTIRRGSATPRWRIWAARSPNDFCHGLLALNSSGCLWQCGKPTPATKSSRSNDAPWVPPTKDGIPPGRPGTVRVICGEPRAVCP